MALQILENNGTFYLKGSIDTSTSQSLISHFKHTVGIIKEVTVNIDKVTMIDANGVTALKKLFLTALNNKKIFSIVGYGCKDLYNDFNAPSAA